MAMIDRYKKKGGFSQLVNLIETTGAEKREKFLKMIAEESPTWEKAIKSKMLSMDRMSKWSVEKLMEILPQIPSKAVACAISVLPEEKKQHFLSALPFGERKKVEEQMKEHKPNAGEISSSQIKILNEVRNLVNTGKIKFEKIDPELAIPEDFEDHLLNGMVSDVPSVAAIEVESIAAHHHPVAGSTLAAGGNAPGVSAEEFLLLRKKLVALTQENTQLRKDYKELKDKLEGMKEVIRKIS